jgi:hypothetical protein
LGFGFCTAIFGLVLSLQDLMPGALAAIIRKAPLTPEKVAFAWRTTVGPAVANVTTVMLVEGVLQVASRDQTWQRELRRSTPAILGRLKPLLGDAVTRIEVSAPVSGEPARTRRTGSPPPPRRR